MTKMCIVAFMALMLTGCTFLVEHSPPVPRRWHQACSCETRFQTFETASCERKRGEVNHEACIFATSFITELCSLPYDDDNRIGLEILEHNIPATFNGIEVSYAGMYRTERLRWIWPRGQSDVWLQQQATRFADYVQLLFVVDAAET